RSGPEAASPSGRANGISCWAVTIWVIAERKRLKTIVHTSNPPAANRSSTRWAMSRASSNETRRRPISVRLSWISRPWSRRRLSRPLRPMVRILTSLPSASRVRMRRRASRRIEALKPPASPRSEVATISRWTSSLPVPASSGGAPGLAAGERAEHALHALRIGPRRLGLLLGAAQPRCGDHLHRRGDLLRRPYAADADPQILQARHGLCERPGKALEEFGQRRFGRPGNLALVADRRENFRPLGAQLAEHRRLEAHDVVDRDPG